MRRAVAALYSVALAVHGSATLGQDGDEDVIIMSAWSDPAQCNQGNASRLAYSKFLANYQSLKGSCVAVEGYWYGRALFASSRDAQGDRANVARELRNRRIGL